MIDRILRLLRAEAAQRPGPQPPLLRFFNSWNRRMALAASLPIAAAVGVS